jgi:tetratricopeptide (TPR) repeat protein
MRLLLGYFVTASCAVADPGLIRSGDEACAAGLWDIGALRYEAALAGGRLSRGERAEAGIRLAEALVRSGQPDQALALLKQSHLASRPEAYFWRGQALVGAGRLAEAAATLKPALDRTDAVYRAEALLTLASLLLALDQPAEALLALKPLTESPDPATAAVAHLRQAEILLDQGGPTAARAIVPESEALPARYRREAALVQGRILLAGGRAADAVRVFRSLLENPAGQSLRGFHAAALGLADALAVAEGPRAGLDFLLRHAAAYPEGPLLGAMFERVVLWLPADAASDEELLATLARWIPPLPAAPPAAINPQPGAPQAIWHVPREASPLAPYAFYTMAVALHRAGDAASRAKARVLLTRLRVGFPDHPLAVQGMVDQARWHLADGNPAAAATLLAHLPADLPPPGAALFLQAQTAFEQGDTEAAIELFEQAAASLTAVRRRCSTPACCASPPGSVWRSPPQGTPERLTTRPRRPRSAPTCNLSRRLPPRMCQSARPPWMCSSAKIRHIRAWPRPCWRLRRRPWRPARRMWRPPARA